jgi:hypothetical protein
LWRIDSSSSFEENECETHRIQASHGRELKPRRQAWSPSHRIASNHIPHKTWKKTWRKSGRYWEGKQGEDSAEINERWCCEREREHESERESINLVPWFEDPFAGLVYPLTGGVKTVKWKYEDSEEGRFVEELEYFKVWKLKPLKRLKERRRERKWKLKRKDAAARVCY